MSASSVDKNLLLVTTIKNYPCLYNQNSPEYLKKDAAEKAWNEIATQVQLNVNEMKEKWRNLRYSLLRSLKPNIDGTAKKKYYLHDEMEFLLPFMKLKGQGNLTPFEEDTDEENVIFTDQDGDPLNQQPICEYELYTEPVPKKRKTENQANQRSSSNEHSRKFFLLSLLPEVNSLTEYQMKVFRRKIFMLLDDITESTNNYGNKQSHRNSDEAIVINDLIKTEPL